MLRDDFGNHVTMKRGVQGLYVDDVRMRIYRAHALNMGRQRLRRMGLRFSSNAEGVGNVQISAS